MARLYCCHLSWLWLGWIPRAPRVSSPMKSQRGRRRMLSPPSTSLLVLLWWREASQAKPSQAEPWDSLSHELQGTDHPVQCPMGLGICLALFLSSGVRGLTGGLWGHLVLVLLQPCPPLLCLRVRTHEPCQRNSQLRGLTGYMLFQGSLSFPPYFLLWFPV